jgi:hypothetical protein
MFFINHAGVATTPFVMFRCFIEEAMFHVSISSPFFSPRVKRFDRADLSRLQSSTTANTVNEPAFAAPARMCVGMMGT